MDPNACYAEYLEAMNAGDLETGKEKRMELLEWLSRGGFEPEWTAEDKEWFMVQKFSSNVPSFDPFFLDKDH